MLFFSEGKNTVFNSISVVLFSTHCLKNRNLRTNNAVGEAPMSAKSVDLSYLRKYTILRIFLKKILTYFKLG